VIIRLAGSYAPTVITMAPGQISRWGLATAGLWLGLVKVPIIVLLTYSCTCFHTKVAKGILELN